MLSLAQYNMSWSGAWPSPKSTSNSRPPINRTCSATTRVKVGGKGRHHPEIGLAPGGNEISCLRNHAVAQVKIAIGLCFLRLRVERDVEAAEIAAEARQQRQVELLAQPACKSDMIGMKVGDNQARQPPSGKWPSKERLPS